MKNSIIRENMEIRITVLNKVLMLIESRYAIRKLLVTCEAAMQDQNTPKMIPDFLGPTKFDIS